MYIISHCVLEFCHLLFDFTGFTVKSLPEVSKDTLDFKSIKMVQDYRDF